MAEDQGGDPASCRRCAAVLAQGSVFCEECGTPVEEGRRAVRSASPQEKYLVAVKLRKAERVIRVSRGAFWFLSAACVLVFLVHAWGIFSGHAGSPRDLVGIALWGCLSVLLVSGAILVGSNPFLWSILLASGTTLMGAWLFLETGFFRAIILGVVFWAGVPVTAPIRRILEEYPDLLVVRRYQGKLKDAPHGRTMDALRAKERIERRRFLRRMLLWGGGSIAVVAIGATVTSVLGRTPPPPPLEPVVAAFSSAWGRAAWEEVNARFSEDSRERMGRGMGRLLKARGWNSAPPALGTPDLRPGPAGRARAVYLVPGGELVTSWEYRERGWVLTGVKFPEK